MSENNELMVKGGSLPKPAGNAVAQRDNVLVVDEGSQSIEMEFDKPKRIGVIIALMVFGVFGLWATLMPIAGAVHAIGQVNVRSFRKPIQHLEGGIIKEVVVKEGSHVQAGDVVLIMDNTQSQAQLSMLNTQRKSRLAVEARLLAERDKLPSVIYPAELSASDPVARAEMQAQTLIFEARRTSQKGEIALLEQRVDQLETQIKGLESVRDSKQKLTTSFEAELNDVKSLLAEGFADKNHLRELQRSYDSTSADAAQMSANIAVARIQIGEAKLEMLQLQNRIQNEVVSELSEVQTELKDMGERLIALTDIVSRTEVRSPETGVVNNLKVHSKGTVIPSGAIIAEIVPQSDELVVDAKIPQMEIDRVVMGQEASVHMTALNKRTTPTLYGNVINVSADALAEPSGVGFYYMARVQLKPDSLAELGDTPLVPGMPAEVLIYTGSRTFFQYLMKPFTDSMTSSLRED